MEYAVVKIGGSQYKVKEGDEFEVLRLPQKEEEEIEFPEVLLVVADDKLKIGQPQVLGAAIKAKILSHFKGEKIRVARFKAKSRYRKVKGFRPYLTRIKVLGIVVSEKIPNKKKESQKAQKDN